MILTDTHTHLYSKEFDADKTALIEKAINSGITRFFLPNIDSESIPGMFQIEKQFPDNCFAMMGLHPCSVNENYQQELMVIEHWSSKRKFVGIGEIGIVGTNAAVASPSATIADGAITVTLASANGTRAVRGSRI